jgi:RNA polymerase sigma factor (sigma-70 family)
MSSSQFKKAFPHDLSARLAGLYRQTGDETLKELAERFESYSAASSATSASSGENGERREPVADRGELEAFRDRLSTRLMDCYRASQSQEAFSLLYEVNFRLFTNVITARLRRFYFHLDVQDVLQEVFFNIYRYPHKFHADKDQAFRHWASMIIRNTVYKSTKTKDRELSREIQDEEIEARPDVGRETPLVEAMNEESRNSCAGALSLMLQIYHAAYEELSTRERKALRMVEIEGEPYKVAAEALGIRLENLKMVVFRARKKILRSLERTMNRALMGPLSDEQLDSRRSSVLEAEKAEAKETGAKEAGAKEAGICGRSSRLASKKSRVEARTPRVRSRRIPPAGARESSRFAQPQNLRIPESKNSGTKNSFTKKSGIANAGAASETEAPAE